VVENCCESGHDILCRLYLSPLSTVPTLR
jgi:hypothetical protein